MIDFTKQYERVSWLNFLEDSFLPDDFRIEEKNINYSGDYAKEVTKLGECPSLKLAVFEMKHSSVNDARIGLSKETFALVRNYTNGNRALVFLIPQNNNDVYRFSFVELTPVVNEKGKVERETTNPRRYSYKLGKGCKVHTPTKYLISEGKIREQTRNTKNYSVTDDLKYRFSVEVLTKEFYDKLFDWYDEWAIKEVKFPNGFGRKVSLEEGDQNRIHLIRLLTRFIFVWFIKQRNLVPEWIFDKDEIENTLKNFKSDSSTSGNYYNGIIQNLFFATLNTPINERKFANEKEDERVLDYRINTRYRDIPGETMFSINKDDFVSRFSSVPFLNGGLFECLDNFDTKEYIDGFSREKTRCAFVPNALFWGNSEREGIITLFNTYNFTVEENTPQDIDIALDPELLGKVFENLLGSFNKETENTARDESGSFYTPREIVDYMVDTSLKEYLSAGLNNLQENLLDNLFSYSGGILNISENDSLYLINRIHNIKILDPACGSGAFPMGILNKLTLALEKIDPENKQWKELQRQKAIKDTEEAFKIGNKDERNNRLKEISDIFEYNSGNYARKLFLIEKCIYGADIQPIAIQISKLRFFISLIVDQKTSGMKENNYNILPLPNLETKFIAADSLVGIKRLKKGDQGLFTDTTIQIKQKELLEVRHKHFSARNAGDKINLRQQDKRLTKELSDLLKKDGFYNSTDGALISKWNPYNQTESSEFFDPYWMFGFESGFDIIIGNPPYVESRNNLITDEQKEKYLAQVEEDFGNLSDLISRGSDLLIYFFTRAISLLSQNGISILIVQNGWLNTDYGAKASKFLLKTLQSIRVIDSSYRLFDRNSANINTVITSFKKTATNKIVSFDLMKLSDGFIVTEQNKSLEISSEILSKNKWGFIMSSQEDIFNIFTKIFTNTKIEDQSFYSVGQGVNEKKEVFIPIEYAKNIKQKENIINAIFKENSYFYKDMLYFLYHSFSQNKSDISFLKEIAASEFSKGKIIKRKYPSIIMPRGIGEVFFAGILPEKTLSNSYVDIYIQTSDENKKLNIWLFCNSSLFTLYREITARKNLGGGLIKAEASDIKNIPLYFPIADKKSIQSIVKEVGEPIKILERIDLEIQQKIDNLVFTYFGIGNKYNLVLAELRRLVEFRIQKAKS